jgi:anti-sigma factor RsiW
MDFRDLAPTSCSTARRRLSLRADGELPSAEHELLLRHLTRCSDCRLWAVELDAITSALRAAHVDSVPHPAEVASAGARPRRGFGRTVVAVTSAAAAAAAAAVVLFGPARGALFPPVSRSAAVHGALSLKERQEAALGSRAPAPITLRPSIPEGVDTRA